MHFEIERKFLVIDNSFIQDAFEKKHISQGYICKEKQHTIRVRISDSKAYLTIKGESSANGLTRLEWEKEISLDDAKTLETLCSDHVIKKTRYLVNYKSNIFEVDVFEGENIGLIVAEIELKEENSEFEKPKWLGKEVTGDKKYYNSYLSLHPYNQW